MEKRTLKIALTGPESSGKSTLCAKLATKLEAHVVKEFARSYLQHLEYTKEDIIYMARQQIRLEQEALSSGASLIICDTDLLNFKIWLAYYSYEIPEFIENYIASKPYDYTLLLYPNTPWIADGLRDKPKERMVLYQLFEKELNHYQYSFSIIDKLGEDRERQALEQIFQILKH